VFLLPAVLLARVAKICLRFVNIALQCGSHRISLVNLRVPKLRLMAIPWLFNIPTDAPVPVPRGAQRVGYSASKRCRRTVHAVRDATRGSDIRIIYIHTSSRRQQRNHVDVVENVFPLFITNFPHVGSTRRVSVFAHHYDPE
jgi:hypothetical protein